MASARYRADVEQDPAAEGTFQSRVERYLASALGQPNLKLLDSTKFTAGGSRETWCVQVECETASGGADLRELVVRMDPDTSLLPSNRHTEYAVYEAFGKLPGVPVPRVLLNEDDTVPLGHSFFVMEKADGAAEPATLLSPAYDAGRPQIARDMMQILGRIAGLDFVEAGLGDVLGSPALEDVWGLQLDHWERTLRDHDLGPNPVTEAAIRQLRRQPPPPPLRPVVVHGDYRIGNFLYSADRIEAILDWEMAHVGDPHEDLGWAFARNWRSGANPHLMAGLLEREEAIELWEQASGLRVDHDALRWWELFTHVKAIAIWIAGAHTQALAYSTMNWVLSDQQEKWMLEDMGVLS